MANSTRPLPYPPTKPSRRPLHAPSQSTSSSTSTRRTSLPTLHLHPLSTATPASPHSPLPAHDNSENVNNDDLFNYSSLSSYTFGAASSTSRRDYESDSLSPLTTLSAPADRRDRGGAGDDHTPRPSISHPRNDDEDDEDEARRYNRAKMRAIDDGGRRPSLPTNLHSGSSGDEATCPSPGPSSTRDHSKQESQTSIDMDQDLSQDAGVIDTDVEYESGFDTASVHTFGMGRRGARGVVASRVWDLSDSEVESEGETHIPRSASSHAPSFFRTHPSDDDGSGQDSGEERQKGSGVEVRRGSLPAAIPARTPTSAGFAIDDFDLASRDREGSIATLRRPSRSVDDELRALNAGISIMGVLPPSPTDTRTVALDRSSGTTAQDTYAELDLAYIMDGITGGGPGSRRSSLSFVQPLSPPPKEKGKGKEKGKNKNKDKGKGKGKSEFDPNDFGSPSSLLDVAPWATDVTYPPRRPSTITISGDDTFAKGLREADPSYTNSRLEWSFIRDPTTGPLPDPIPGAKPAKHEIWRCEHIGKVVVDRISVLTSDTTRPPQQRLNVAHKVDPTSIGNRLGGPACIIHKHSKATAFSIFRSYGLLDHRRAKNPNDPSHIAHMTLPTSNSFLLAPKKVQEQYTNTKSTKMLSTHGLLEDRKPRPTPSRSREGSSRRALPERGAIPFGDPRAGRHIIDPKDLPTMLSSSPPGRTPSTSAATSLDVPRSSESSIPLITANQRPLKEVVSSREGSQSTILRPVQVQQVEEEESYSDSDLERQATRTSHAEAFATLDPVSLEQYRARNPMAVEKDVSVTNWIKQKFRQGGTPRPAQTNFVVDPINPPWMTLAPRGQQEEQDQVIKTLNTSFVDVGLLPSTRKKGAGIGRKGHSRNANVLTHVPDDALYMLLPLWPRETDSLIASKAPQEEETEPPEVANRLYLLVYYVPFERRDKKSGALVADVAAAKKRSRSSQRKGEYSSISRSIVLDSFRAIARLMSYDDLRGSGVRLPARGLAVTGPMEDAMRGIPPAKLRDVHQDDFVIAIYASRAAGRVEFLPDGLEKLGLCEPRTDSEEAYHPAMQVRESEELEPQPLTAIGRAAVEMAWLGCMALTNFQGY
ncbi:hypothetical protein OF83DRAFT_1172832 [Amylostereum chailletii]|nr:hypothetical protein OF83DRAFT_1172832 [Amylostereum chailletii]